LAPDANGLQRSRQIIGECQHAHLIHVTGNLDMYCGAPASDMPSEDSDLLQEGWLGMVSRCSDRVENAKAKARISLALQSVCDEAGADSPGSYLKDVTGRCRPYVRGVVAPHNDPERRILTWRQADRMYHLGDRA